MLGKNNKIIVALDFPTISKAEQFVGQLKPEDCRLKVGNILFTQAGPTFVRQLIDLGFEVFLDLKYHDIPNTVLGAVQAAADLGVWMVNLHCLSGRSVLEAVGKWASSQQSPPLCIGVTALTSLSDTDLQELGLGSSKDCVLRLAGLAHESGLDGVVCSAHEAAMLKSSFGADFQLVTPGIRLGGDQQDQQRVMTPTQAWEAGADHLVMGRAITQAADPVGVLHSVYS